MDVQPVRPLARVLGWVLLLVGLVLPTERALAQKPSNWRVFQASDGLHESFSVALSVNSRLCIRIAHSDPGALSWTDGYESRKPYLRGLRDLHVYEGRSGQMWALNPQGLQELQNETWISYPIHEIRDAWARTGPKSISLAPLRYGHVLCLVPEQVFEFNLEQSEIGEVSLVRKAAQTKLEQFTDLVEARDSGFWVSGRKGLAKIPSTRPASPDTTWQEFVPSFSSDLANFQSPKEDEQGGVTLVAETVSENKRMVVHFDGENWSILPPPPPQIQHAWKGSGSSFWCLTGTALYELDAEGKTWQPHDEISATHFFDVATVPGGAFFLASSEGVFRYAPLTWQSSGSEVARTAIMAAADRGEDRFWFTQPRAVVRWQNEHWKITSLPDDIPSLESADELFVLANGNLLIGSIIQPFIYDPKTEMFELLVHPSGLPVKPLGRLKDGAVCVQVGSPSEPGAPIILESYNGREFRPFQKIPAEIHQGLELNFANGTQSGALWLARNDRLALYRDQKWTLLERSEERSPENPTCMLELGENRFWCGTRDKIWEYDGKEWTIVKLGLDRVNQMIKAHDGSIWVASNSGIYRFHKGEFVANGIEEGLPSLAVRCLLEDKRGRLWAGTTRGLVSYHPEADSDPPRTYLAKSPTEFSPDAMTTFFFSGKDKWKQTPAERLLYSYRLDEQEWSPWKPETVVTVPELAPGKHFFQVRAIDRNWNIDPTPALLNFTVPLPWYKETRLVLITFAGMTGVLFFAALAFNRHRRLLKSYAEVERIVQLRTRQLEEANRDLFQSQKLNALGTLAAGIAHDFNSILSIIKGSAQIIESNLQDSQKVRTRVDRIKTAVDQGSGIVKAMLGFSRTSDRHFTGCDLNELGKETIRLLGDRFQRTCTVKLQCQDDLPPVLGAKDFIQQILLNLILNGAEAMSGSGQIELRTGMLTALPTSMVLMPAETSAYAYIAVRDTGCGIPPEVMPRIFEPFFTTKALSTKRGTGLGLSMVYQLAKEMGAGLKVESVPGQGSTFTLILRVGGDGNK